MDQFEARYGKKASLVVRCPARVNLIGEHIDYSGFAVIPLAMDALQAQCMGTYSPSSEDHLSIGNTSSLYPSFTISGGSNQDEATADQWRQSVYLTYTYVKDKVSEEAAYRHEILYHSTIPIAGGLSSSTALILSFLSYFTKVYRLTLSPSQFVTSAVEIERQLGIQCGNMDQAAMVYGTPGNALKITCDPLSVSPLPLPTSTHYILCNSLVQAHKLQSKESAYNVRVFECFLAAKLLASKLRLKGDLTTLKQVMTACPRLRNKAKTPADMILLVERNLQLGGYKKAKIMRLLQWKEVDWEGAVERYHITAQSTYYIAERALHVYAEADRVLHFENLCGREPYEDQYVDMSVVLNESHESLRDLYGTSTAAVEQCREELMELGFQGMRMIGAGWGGWLLGICRADQVDTLTNQLHRYYEAHTQTPRSNYFIVRAGQGLHSVGEVGHSKL